MQDCYDPTPASPDVQGMAKAPARAIAVKSATKSGAPSPGNSKPKLEIEEAERQKLTGFTKSKPSTPALPATLATTGPPAVVPPKAWQGGYGELRPPPPPRWQGPVV